MDARRRNCRVLIQKLTAGQDDIGQPTQVWGNLIATGDGKIYANIRYLNGVETIKADATTPITKASISIGRRTDVTTAMRVTYGGTTFQINNILPDATDRNRLDLACEVVG